MPIEAEAVPFEPANLRGERLLVLAPHPDDEAIACGGLIAQHLREHRAVRVMVATDGSAADSSTGGDSYRERREDESRRGLAILGGGEISFLRIPDRQLGAYADAFRDQLGEILRDFAPSLILVPSPIEIHPDHMALATAFCELIQRDEHLFAQLAVAQVAFYELTQPIRPNAIVDISDVAQLKFEAIAAHESQIAVRDYRSFACGLNAFRAMTMPPGTTYAEAYWVVALPELRTIPVSQLQRTMGDARLIATVESEHPQISVIVRTKDRPALLREAVESIRATRYPAEVVVVNDGGVSPEWLRSDNTDSRTKLIDHDRSRGRSEAANAGVRAASSPLVCFLDDDDLQYPEHLAVLSRAFSIANKPAAYSDAVSAFLSVGASGQLEASSRQRLFATDYDADLLLVDNYIPLPTLLLRRDDFLDLGGFDPEFDLFEDWEFLIRLSARGSFVRVPRITCEIRHIQGAGSIVMASPEGSKAFQEAKLQVWRKHEKLITPDVFVRAIERQKRVVQQVQDDSVWDIGRMHSLSNDVTRLEREKNHLISELQIAHELAIRADETAVRLRESQAANEQKAIRLAAVEEENAALRSAVEETSTTVQALFAEVRRLQSLLDMIYTSRTWKLHTMVEKVRGRD